MLIVLEGLDGAGKTTQADLLQKHFESENRRSKFLHFPRFDAPVYGDLIASFLRGEFGDVNTVDPRLVALLYAGDRNSAAPELKSWLARGEAVILDRYVYSNIAFQCAKVSDSLKRKNLREWIFSLEFDFFAIPRPDINIFLDVPFDFTVEKLRSQREGTERDYLKGKKDIHESDFDLQRRVREIYVEQTNIDGNFVPVNCVDENSGMKTPQTVHREIITLIEKRTLRN
ncbi:MAG: dTMP kinase [Prevotellaceae bacterium]|jgi:dTMP kinase|nr:dTMP kinase [Prevotellaceae bacterium]